MTPKVSRDVSQNEGLIFEKSSPGKRAYQLPPAEVTELNPAKVLGAENIRNEIAGFP